MHAQSVGQQTYLTEDKGKVEGVNINKSGGDLVAAHWAKPSLGSSKRRELTIFHVFETRTINK